MPATADGTVHAAAESGLKARDADALAIETLTTLPPKDGRFLVYTSGIWVLGAAPSPVDETAPVNPIEIASWRPAHEQRVLETSKAGVRAMVIRPGVVYGGSRGMVGDIVKDAANSLVRVVGRLSTGTTLPQADATVQSAMAALAARYPASHQEKTGGVEWYFPCWGCFRRSRSAVLRSSPRSRMTPPAVAGVWAACGGSPPPRKRVSRSRSS